MKPIESVSAQVIAAYLKVAPNTFQVTAEDPEKEGALRYRLAKAPAGMTITPFGGLVEWRPRPDQNGVHAVQIVVEDASGAASHQGFELTTGPPAARAP